MVIHMDYHDSSKIIYQCDRCKRKLTRLETWSIKSSLGGYSFKILCHLCDRCYKALEKGIKKGV